MKSLSRHVVFAVFLFLSACNSGEGSRTDSNQNEKEILRQEPFAAITDSIRVDKKNAGLYIHRAEMLSQKGEHVLAYNDLLQAWALSPSEYLAEARINNLFMQGKSEASLDLLKELTKRYPQNNTLKRRMGEALMQSGQYEKAFAAYDQMIKDDSLDFEAYYERATLHLEKKDTLAALKDLERSFRIQPLQLTALSLANLYAETKNPRALELADMVIARDSAKEIIDPVFIKGVYYANTKNPQKALELFNECIKMDWKFQEVYIEKGLIYFDQKNLDEALQQFKLAATVSNTYPDAYYWQGRCYEVLGMKEEAINNYARAYALDKNFKEAIDAVKRLSK